MLDVSKVGFNLLLWLWINQTFFDQAKVAMAAAQEERSAMASELSAIRDQNAHLQSKIVASDNRYGFRLCFEQVSMRRW
jgi:hypothetical protein